MWPPMDQARSILESTQCPAPGFTFLRPWETAAPVSSSTSPPIPAPRNIATLSASSSPPIPAPRNISTSSASPSPPIPAPRIVATPSLSSPSENDPAAAQAVEQPQLRLIEAHKGGVRLLYDSYLYIRNRSTEEKT